MKDKSRLFFDTNILLYLLSEDDIKATKTERLVEHGGVISVQVLNEMTNVARRKLSLSWEETRGLIDAVRSLCIVNELSESTYVLGCRVAERYRLGIYDAMIVASALESNCNTLWSEDMHSGLIIENNLEIINPYRLP